MKRLRYMAAGAALALVAVGGINLLTQEAQAPGPTSTPDASQAVATFPLDSASELWSVDDFLATTKPLDINLDAKTQWAIYRECGYNDSLFCTVMAIAAKETVGFDLDAVGDNGTSLGIMQINTRWHTERMEALGVTDLTDPVQCAAVAIDYLAELESRYGYTLEDGTLLMAYNMGPTGARNALEAGITATDYSEEVLELYWGFMEELEGGQR